MSTKERCTIARVCHLHITKCTALAPVATPKSLLVSVSYSRTKAMLRSPTPFILTPDMPYIPLNIRVSFSYLFSFREKNSRVWIRLHKLKKPNVVYASGAVSLQTVFFCGFAGEVTLKGAIEKKNLGKELFRLACVIETTPFEYNQPEDVERWLTECHSRESIVTVNNLEALDLYFDGAENDGDNESDSDELRPQDAPVDHQEAKFLSQKIQSKMGDPKDVSKPKDDAKHRAAHNATPVQSRKSRRADDDRLLPAGSADEHSDDSTETEDVVRPFAPHGDDAEWHAVFVMNPRKRRTSRFYEALGHNVGVFAQEHYRVLFASSCDEMKGAVAALLRALSERGSTFKVVLCGSDALVSCFVRFYCEAFAKKKARPAEQLLDLLYVPVGKTCEVALLLAGSERYRNDFCSAEWGVMFQSRVALPGATAAAVMERVHSYVQAASVRVGVPLGEVQLTGTGSTIVPFLKTVDLVSRPQETKPAVSVDLCKQNKDKQHITKMKKSLYTINVVKLATAKAMRLLDGGVEVKDAILFVQRKERERGRQSCEQVMKLYRDEARKKKDKKKEEKELVKSTAGKKEEKDESAHVSFCNKAIVTSEEAAFGVFIDGRRFPEDVRSVTIKDVWNGFREVSFATYN